MGFVCQGGFVSGLSGVAYAFVWVSLQYCYCFCVVFCRGCCCFLVCVPCVVLGLLRGSFLFLWVMCSGVWVGVCRLSFCCVSALGLCPFSPLRLILRLSRFSENPFRRAHLGAFWEQTSTAITITPSPLRCSAPHHEFGNARRESLARAAVWSRILRSFIWSYKWNK